MSEDRDIEIEKKVTVTKKVNKKNQNKNYNTKKKKEDRSDKKEEPEQEQQENNDSEEDSGEENKKEKEKKEEKKDTDEKPKKNRMDDGRPSSKNTPKSSSTPGGSTGGMSGGGAGTAGGTAAGGAGGTAAGGTAAGGTAAGGTAAGGAAAGGTAAGGAAAGGAAAGGAAAGGAAAGAAAGGAAAGAAAGGAMTVGGPVLIGIVVVVLVLIIINILTNDTAVDEDIEMTSNARAELVEAYDSGELTGDAEQLELATSISDSYSSALAYNMEQIDYIYNKVTTVEDSTSVTRKATIEAYETVYGENEDNTSGIYTIDDKREMYKHILSTEKYNFNEIEWVSYTHTNSSGSVISEDDLYKDTELGLMYPNDDSTDVSTYLNMTSPYLLSNMIPLAFLSATVTAGDSSFEYVPDSQELNNEWLEQQGIEVSTDSTSSENYQNKATFAYEIIKYGMSDITIDQYQLETYTETTKYDDYTATTYYDTFTVTQVEKITYDENGNAVYSYWLESVTTPTQNEVSSEDVDSRNNDGSESKTEEELRLGEEKVSESKDYNIIYYLSYVKAFDVVKNWSYTFTPYSDDDVASRTSNNEDVETVEYEPKTVNEENKVNTDDITKGYTKVDSLASSYGGSASSSSTTTTDTAQDGSYTINRTNYTITTGQYTINDGDTIYTTRTWSDQVTAGASTSSDFSLEELYEFDENEEGDTTKTTIERSVLSAHEDIDHYSDLVSNKELNVIDILDSNPGIYKKYLGAGNQQSDYIGYGRNNGTIVTLAYHNLQTYLDSVAEDNILPFAYGSSLGYETSAYTQTGSYSSSSYGSLDIITDRSNPDISEEEKQSLLSEMAASGYKRASWAAQYGAWTIQYYKNYPSEIIARILMAELSAMNETEASVYLVAAHAIAIVNYANEYYDGDIYRYCLDGQITISQAAVDRMNQVPPQFYREIATAAVRGTLPYPPGYTGEETHWIGPADTTANATYDWYKTTTSTCAYVYSSSIWHAFQTADNTGYDQRILPISGQKYLLNEQYKIATGVYVNPGTGASTELNYTSIKEAMDDAYTKMTGTIVEESGAGYTNLYSVAGKTYKEYKQDLFAKGTYRYWGGDVASQGCNVTCVCVIASAYDESVKNMDYYCGPSGRYRNGPIGTATEVQSIVNATGYINAGSDATQQIIDNLTAGRAVVIHEKASGGSHFTSNQHWMVLLDIKSENGQTMVYLSTVNTWNTSGWYEISYALSGLVGYIMVLE